MTPKIGRGLLKAVCVAAVGVAAVAVAQEKAGPQQPWSKWKVHDMERPAPPVVTPGTFSTNDQPGKPPSDAIVLFDGSDLSHWQAAGGGEPTFTLQDGLMRASKMKDPKKK